MAAFPPIIGAKPKVLILGSMPGQASLKQARYYAHPQNAFWWIMANCVGFAESLSYEERLAKLKSAGIAVWDVLHDCDRKGSLDSRIVRDSEVSNDFSALLRQYPTIKKILFNGAAAESIFKRHWQALIAQKTDLVLCRLPSTSPAFASMPREQKKRQWLAALPS